VLIIACLFSIIGPVPLLLYPTSLCLLLSDWLLVMPTSRNLGGRLEGRSKAEAGVLSPLSLAALGSIPKASLPWPFLLLGPSFCHGSNFCQKGPILF
jgi:hypothetical protein